MLVSQPAASRVFPNPIRPPRQQEKYFFDERHEKFDNSFERILLQRMLVCRQETENIRKSVVNGVVFRGKLREKHFRQICNTSIFILQTLRHLTKLSFNFDLPSEDKEGEGHQARFFDRGIAVAKSSVQEIRILVNQSVEAHSLHHINNVSQLGHVTISPSAITALLRMTGFFDLSMIARNKGSCASQNSAYAISDHKC